MPDGLTWWTAWAAMACLGATFGVSMSRATDRHGRDGAARWLWTLGCVLLWIHVGCAFQFQHHWSHAVAYAHTAEQTAAMTGINWGGGLYFNYLLMLVWAGDALWWWLAPESYHRRPAAVRRFVTGFAIFMAFNATVVFGSGMPRWIALVACASLLTLRLKKKSG
jgi:hypothetical protein